MTITGMWWAGEVAGEHMHAHIHTHPVESSILVRKWGAACIDRMPWRCTGMSFLFGEVVRDRVCLQKQNNRLAAGYFVFI